MFTGFADQLPHVPALAPLTLLHVGQLMQLELGVDDDILLMSPELSGGSGVAAVTG